MGEIIKGNFGKTKNNPYSYLLESLEADNETKKKEARRARIEERIEEALARNRIDYVKILKQQEKKRKRKSRLKLVKS